MATDSNSPARDAGLKSGDLITAINGRKVQDVDASKRMLNNAEPGSLLRLTILRGFLIRPFSEMTFRQVPASLYVLGSNPCETARTA